MAISLKNSIDLLYGSILNIYDVTGTYNVSTNLEGWGSPNITRAGITSATIKIYFPDSTVADITTVVTTTVQNATTEDFLLISYSLTDLGLSGTSLPDGIYQIEYIVVSGGVTYSNIQSFLSYYSVKCCVQNKFAEFISNRCNCQTSDILMQWSMLKAITFGVAGGNLIDAQKVLTKLQKICSTNKCC